MRHAFKDRGFTLIELLVVVAMIMILAAAMTSAVASAQRRARIQQAVAETQEMTNAILAYENYSKDNELPEKDDEEASLSSVGFILGDGKNEYSGKQVPILYNAATTRDSDGRILDPWGQPYRVTIRSGSATPTGARAQGPKSYVMFPNFNRRPADEVEEEGKKQ